MTAGQRYKQLWREIQLADQLGFDFGFAVEHHFTPRESWMATPSLYCVGAAANTSRIRLGAMGHIVPLYHPLRLAEEIATADQIIDGRLEVGLVPGIAHTFFTPYQVDYQQRRDLTLEFIEFLEVAFTESDSFDFNGPFHQFKNVKLAVNPVQMPHPPLWLETRDRATLTVGAKHGMSTGYTLLTPRSEVVGPYRRFLEEWREAGWPRKPNIAHWILTYVDETDDKAIEKAAPAVSEAFAGFLTVRGGTDTKAEQNRLAEFFEQRKEAGTAETVRHLFDFNYLMDHDLLLVGSPKTVADRIRKIAVNGLFNTVFAEVNFGSLDEDDLMRSIRLFGEEVIPQVRDFEPF